ncbi:MAG: DUF998 domain-containing protein [Dehalogenimonas sp.]
MYEFFALFGIVGPLLYFITVILGAIRRPNYSHIKDTISELASPDSPNLPLINTMFAFYNISIFFFGLSVLFLSNLTTTFHLNVVGLLTLLVGVLGLGMLFFPQDPIGQTMTHKGRIHIALAGLTSPATMISMVITALYFGSAELENSAGSFVGFTWVFLASVFVFGLLAAANIARHTRFAGLFERLTIGSYLMWIFIFAVLILTNNLQ